MTRKYKTDRVVPTDREFERELKSKLWFNVSAPMHEVAPTVYQLIKDGEYEPSVVMEALGEYMIARRVIDEDERDYLNRISGLPASDVRDDRDGLAGKKADVGKPRMDLLAPEFLEGIATVLEFGARKYGDRNWEKGMRWGRVYGALMRHLNAWLAGEELDDETQLPHLWHAGCCLMFLSTYVDRGIGLDDRKPLP